MLNVIHHIHIHEIDKYKEADMGLDAYVQCNCFRDGKAKNPPFDPKLLTFKNNILDISEDVDDDTYYSYINWIKDACEHTNFEIIQERVSNASGMNFLWSIIDRIGIEQFPNFAAMWKEDYVKCELAQLVKKEIEMIKLKAKDVKGIFLVDKETNEEYWAVIEGDDNWFYSHGKELNYKLNDSGFYITDIKDEQLFSSKDFIQDVTVTRNGDKMNIDVLFQDALTGETFKSIKAIERCINWATKDFYYPRRLIVKKRNLETSDCYTLLVLERLIEASILTGNPIVWE
jgi:hypothetical protein